MFFFEKKNQKTFDRWSLLLPLNALVLLAACHPVLAAQAPDSGTYPDTKSFYNGFIAPLRLQRRSIFISGCHSVRGTSVLFFAVGASRGHYAEFARNGLQTNGATISLEGSVKLDDLMGGFGTRAVEEKIVAALLNTTFKLLPPDQLRNWLNASASTECPGVR